MHGVDEEAFGRRASAFDLVGCDAFIPAAPCAFRFFHLEDGEARAETDRQTSMASLSVATPAELVGTRPSPRSLPLESPALLLYFRTATIAKFMAWRPTMEDTPPGESCDNATTPRKPTRDLTNLPQCDMQMRSPRSCYPFYSSTATDPLRSGSAFSLCFQLLRSWTTRDEQTEQDAGVAVLKWIANGTLIGGVVAAICWLGFSAGEQLLWSIV